MSSEPKRGPFLMPWGIHTLTDTDTGELKGVALDDNHFILSKLDLRIRKLRTIGLCLLVGAALGLTPKATDGISTWWGRRQDNIAEAAAFNQVHYKAAWQCSNCTRSNSSYVHGGIDVPNGVLVEDFLGEVACRNCGVVGLSKHE